MNISFNLLDILSANMLNAIPNLVLNLITKQMQKLHNILELFNCLKLKTFYHMVVQSLLLSIKS